MEEVYDLKGELCCKNKPNLVPLNGQPMNFSADSFTICQSLLFNAKIFFFFFFFFKYRGGYQVLIFFIDLYSKAYITKTIFHYIAV